MSEMVERVTKAIHESLGYETPWETCTQCEDAARAALRAMRSPTEEMKNATYLNSWDAQEVWEEMISAALKD